MLENILKIAAFMTAAYRHSWPYLLVTIPFAVLINISGISRHIERAFNARPVAAVILATAVGAFSPFCSCGVIPVISALLIGGVPLAPVMSFWLASPSMDPEIFFLSVTRLGMNLALWRLAGTFIMSITAGLLTLYLVKTEWIGKEVLRNSTQKKKNPQFLFKRFFQSGIIKITVPALSSPCRAAYAGCSCRPLQENINYCCSGSTKMSEVPAHNSSGCAESCNNSQEKIGKSGITGSIYKESKKAVLMVLKFMTLAFFLEALIVLFLPQEWITSLLGKDNSFSIPLSALISIPLYTTNITALGLIGGLLKQGMDPGAALTFLIGGATTTLPAMAAVYGIVKKRVFIIYIAFAAGSSLLAGYLYKLITFIKLTGNLNPFL